MNWLMFLDFLMGTAAVVSAFGWGVVIWTNMTSPIVKYTTQDWVFPTLAVSTLYLGVRIFG